MPIGLKYLPSPSMGGFGVGVGLVLLPHPHLPPPRGEGVLICPCSAPGGRGTHPCRDGITACTAKAMSCGRGDERPSLVNHRRGGELYPWVKT
jgi:hypothetical protein